MRSVLWGWAAAALLSGGNVQAADDAKALEERFQPAIQTIVARYCQDCHNAETAEAELNLAAFTTFAEVRKQPEAWRKVGEMLDSGQMPPKEARQPTDAEREQLQKWVRGYLTMEAAARAGDPGRVVLRRLSNAEYAYTLRDLTGVASLDPAREFPVDGAAGEGFSNTGNALVMSPALVTKYLDAAKGVSRHAVLLPDGFRFSRHATRRDWTNETLDRIRAFYGRYTDATDGEKINLQGVVFNTNGGGRLPLERYLAATLAERDALAAGSKSIEQVARDRQLSAKYLGMLHAALTGKEPSLLLDPLRRRWREAQPTGARALATEVAAWQKQLWRFSSVGHIGKAGGPKRWMEPVDLLADEEELRFKIPAGDAEVVTLSLVASDAGDGHEHDFVVWRRPRLVAPGRPDILLRDLRAATGRLTARRQRVLAQTAQYLAAADEAAGASEKVVVADLAARHGVDADALAAWLDYLGLGARDAVELSGHFQEKLTKNWEYDFVQGWGSTKTPLLVANSSDQHVRIPGNLKPHSVAVHPSPTERGAVGWRSPIRGVVRVDGSVTHAHPECGNGVTWSLELRRGGIRRRLAAGVARGGKPVAVGPIETLPVRKGDVVSLLIGPRGGNHACDLTAVDLKLLETEGAKRTWDLAGDVSSNVLAGNPHDDRHGHREVWHFYSEPETTADTGPVIPAGSLLAQWHAAAGAERARFARELQTLLTSPAPAAKDSPDAALHRQLTSLGSPLLPTSADDSASLPGDAANANAWGVDPALFGKHPKGGAIDEASLCVQSPSVITIRLPADLLAGYELVTTAVLHDESSAQGSIQAQLVAGASAAASERTIPGVPIIASPGSPGRKRIESQVQAFRELFPVAVCYTKIVPVDEVVTLTLFYREDDHLARLMLDPAEQAELDRLWAELRYVSQDALTLVDALAQLIEFATQDSNPTVFEPLREPFQERADAFRRQLVESEPAHLQSLLEFAAKAYRRPLSMAESQELRELYARLRQEELSHDEALRLVLARVLIAPAFLYRLEQPVAGAGQGPVSDAELATRLSYFLWSSTPDDELLQFASNTAADGGGRRLNDPEALRAQTRRMLADPKIRRLASEFACQWLQIYDFDELDEKSERHFPEFRDLRGAMHEESIRFFTDLFQNNGSLLDILGADHTFLNEPLARHYGISGVTGSEWRKVEGVQKHGRGGILAQAALLSKQSGASRTSPILRGNWISEVLLGERLPRPPPGIPPIPDDESASAELSVRELTERHSSDPKCAVCHVRIDPLGFALERFDAIGRRREKDLAGRLIDTRATTMDGVELDGLDGLRSYLLTTRRDTFVRQFCKKLLGYSLGRSVQLSDEPLLDEMQAHLKAHDYKIHSLIEAIVLSRQFREIRGRDSAYEQ